jgi:signal transduction histidine kinase
LPQGIQDFPDSDFQGYFFGEGAVWTFSLKPHSEDERQVMKKFSSVFSLTFRRYQDLQKAEAQTIRAEKNLIEIKAARIKAEEALSELQATQQQLIQSEKMASLGELTAGIAHEIQNPLNFVNNFSELNRELLAELKEELGSGNIASATQIAGDIEGNEEKINFHGKRADSIVKSMLQHSKTSSGTKEPTDINALAEEFLRLSFHGFRAKEKLFNATINTSFDKNIGKVEVMPQDLGRVLLNLFNNSFYSMNEKKKKGTGDYEPILQITTTKTFSGVEIKVNDNGTGIPEKLLQKIYQPFFTTKPTGEGPGLGLSLSYDIITKGHGGEMKVQTKEGEGTTFIVELPTFYANHHHGSTPSPA